MWLGLRSYGVHPRAYARGVLSFDLEALDRWYGVKAEEVAPSFDRPNGKAGDESIVE